MKTEVRFLLAIGLMLVVLVGTNILFPPAVPDEAVPADTTATQLESSPSGELELPPSVGALPGEAEQAAQEGFEERTVSVESPLYRYTFSNRGGQMVSAEMLRFQALNREGIVDLIPEGAHGVLGQKLLVGPDTIDLTGVPFQAEPADGLRLSEGDGPRELRLTYQHPSRPFGLELTYQFRPESYQVVVRGRVTGVERPLVLTDLGEGVAFSEADSVGEARAMAYVYNHAQEGIESRPLTRAQPGVEEGPLLWAAFKSKFFVVALLAGESEAGATETDYLGGLIIGPSPLEGRLQVTASQTVHSDGTFGYRLFMGPQEHGRLTSLGEDMEDVNPYGWRFFRPIVRPFVTAILFVLTFLHTQFQLGYGWVLIIFGVLMRVVLWPLNQKAMRAQLKNMAVQPLLQEIQSKHKDNPERLQKEMMKLYKEHGFNPLAGCWPMLLPWPVLIALFFVFQNTIELRGVPFLWLPDLSAPDPLYILPVFMGLSMFAMQWFSMKTVPQTNQQMKIMMYVMPVMMVFIFFKLASGLNLYYATANLATIPQQIWINNERKKVQPISVGTLSKKG